MPIAFPNRILAFLGTAFAASVLGIATSQAAVGDGCGDRPGNDPDKLAALINAEGLKAFTPAAVARPISPDSRLDLIVDYAEVRLAGCHARLRTYNGAVVGPTIVAAPGDTLYIRLVNRLPDVAAEHPQNPPPRMHANGFSFNITNLHTHGLHVAPEGSGPVNPATGRREIESDNVLLELDPGEEQFYEIEIPEDHAAGTFWYHAHVHGATAVQVGSGMSGALIVESGEARHGDLEAVREIAAAAEKIMVLQQIWVQSDGTIERPPSTRWPTLVNGQLVPVIKMRPGELQRWRLIHAGVNENLVLSLDNHPLSEVAADGISLGRRVDWPALDPAEAYSRADALFLAPGYRADVLVRISPDAQPGDSFHLRQHLLSPDESIIELTAGIEAAVQESLGLAPDVTPGDLALGQQILVRIEIEGDPVDMPLPDDAALAPVVPAELIDITQAEIDATNAIDPMANREIVLAIDIRDCNAASGECVPCPPGTNCRPAFMVNDKQFTMMNGIAPLRLRTGGEWTAAEWTVSTGGFPMTHPFHIHVNPFQVLRVEPDGAARWRWKDTWATLSDSTPQKLRMRYRLFTGRFVLHCHILQHEDAGMMSLVEIVDN